MTHSGEDRLRERFLAPPAGAGAAPGCPDPDRILALALGELPSEDLRQIVDHAALCPACTVAWRVAREYARESGLDASGAQPRVESSSPRTRLWIASGLAAAAVLALVFVLTPFIRQDRPVPGMRSAPSAAIRSLVPEDRPQARTGLVLRWTGGKEGARYDIRITNDRLEHLAGARGLTEEQFPVPDSALVDLRAGATIYWQVDAIGSDGRRIQSPTFVVVLE